MARYSSKKDARTPPAAPPVSRALREGMLFVLGALAIYLLIALVSYDAADPGWSHSAPEGRVMNAGGVAGAWFADVFLYLFGHLAYLFPLIVGYIAWFLYKGGHEAGSNRIEMALRLGGLFLAAGAGAGLATLHLPGPFALPVRGGGILGDVISRSLVEIFNFAGASLFLLALFLAGAGLFTGLSWLRMVDATGRFTLDGGTRVAGRLRRLQERRAAARETDRVEPAFEDASAKKAKPAPAVRIEPTLSKAAVTPPVKAAEPSLRMEREKQMPLFDPPPAGHLPPLSLLDPPEPVENAMTTEALAAMSRQIESKLKDFGVEAEVVAVHPGPVITRFELQPAPGVKVSQITNLSKDLARALSTFSVRVVEVIPGKSVIGLEVPNAQREIVRLREILASGSYESAHSPLTLALGKDIGGHPAVVDLARMPHLLVAGTTGSGKSVAVNAMILSLVYKATAQDVRVILIDPKMLELSVYEGIPHLLAPVVTDMKEAANALRWCVAEMDRRYRLMAALGVRNLAGFNRKVKDARDAQQPIADPLFPPTEGMTPPPLDTLPYIVVVIDELADMMMVVGKKVEELIARLAQKARASGIHLVLATQRPSVDVITGLIKANIPTRIAFQVSSRIDSRTILDQQGAEHLLGHGDMLYLAPGTGVPVRVHGAFVADHEVHKVVENLKQQGAPVYLDEVLEDASGDEAGGGAADGDYGGAEADPLYDQAVRIVTESRRASISGVQRRLKIGYNRAARMIEDMERAGVVGPLQSNGSREVLAPPPVE